MRTRYSKMNITIHILRLGLSTFVAGMALASVLLLLPKMSVAQAAAIETSSTDVVYTLPGEPFDEANSRYGSIIFIIRYDGESSSPELRAVLSGLQAERRVWAIDSNVSGAILVRGEDAVVLALHRVPGVITVRPVNALLAFKDLFTDFALLESNVNSFAPDSSLTTNAPMRLVGTGAITGIVTAEDTGLPLEYVSVDIYDAGSGNYIDDAYTDINGIFSIGGLSTGNYKLKFVEWDQYAFAWYNNKLDKGSADSIAITDGMTTSISIELTRGGIITGVVTAETSLPLSDIDVYARYETGDSYGTGTDGNGNYTIGGLAAGSYTVCFRDYDNEIYAPECYDDKPYEYGGGDQLAVTAGITLTNINAILSPAAVITGTVTANGSGEPLSNVTVGVHDLGNSWWPLDSDTTNVSGTYRISGLAAGNYKVKFTDDTGVYLSEYHDDKPDFNTADLVNVTGGITTTVDAALTLGGYIAGRVIDADTGAGVANVHVDVEQQDGPGSANAYTDASGYYTTSALISGIYLVHFDPPPPYLEERYDNFKSWPNFTPVFVNAPATTLDINAALTRGYMVTGTVTGTGMPLAGVHVRLYKGNSSYYSGNPSDYTAGDGTYAVDSLEPGEYRLVFVPPADSLYALQWYDGSYTFAGSSVITMPHTSPINAELSYGSRITGVVTGLNSLPLSGIDVNIYEAGASTSNLEWAVSTDADGRYQSPGLAPGKYQVKFDPPWDSRYAEQWYDGQSAQTDATVINVTAGVTITNLTPALL